MIIRSTYSPKDKTTVITVDQLPRRRKPTAKQIAKAIDAQIEQAYYRTCSGVQVSILDIPKIFAAGREALAAGTDLDTAIRVFVDTIRKN